MCCGQTKSWKNTTSMLDYWRVGPLPTQSFEFCCPSIAMAWRLLHPTHWTDHTHVHPWWLPAIEMANPNAWQVGWWWIKLIWVKWKNLRPCLISWWDFCLLRFPLKWGQVKFNTSISSMKAWRNMVSSYLIKFDPPTSPPLTTSLVLQLHTFVSSTCLTMAKKFCSSKMRLFTNRAAVVYLHVFHTLGSNGICLFCWYCIAHIVHL